MAPTHTPSTKIISSTPLSPAQAHAFLTSFTAAAEASKNDAQSGHNEIVFTNLKRIEQALIGIHVPRPVQNDLGLEGLTDMVAPILEEIAPAEGEGEGQEGEYKENGVDDTSILRDGSEEEARNMAIPTIQARVKEKAEKKADKKARRKEEKKQRAEQRKKGKEEENDSDGP